MVPVVVMNAEKLHLQQTENFNSVRVINPVQALPKHVPKVLKLFACASAHPVPLLIKTAGNCSSTMFRSYSTRGLGRGCRRGSGGGRRGRHGWDRRKHPAPTPRGAGGVERVRAAVQRHLQEQRDEAQDKPTAEEQQSSGGEVQGGSRRQGTRR